MATFESEVVEQVDAYGELLVADAYGYARDGADGIGPRGRAWASLVPMALEGVIAIWHIGEDGAERVLEAWELEALRRVHAEGSGERVMSSARLVIRRGPRFVGDYH